MLLNKEIILLRQKISYVAIFWFSLASIAAIVQVTKSAGINNYLIFKGVFWHTVQETNLFLEYPAEYFDVNHYGASFSIFISPFALMPDKIGCFLWCLANAAFLFYAVRQLPLSIQNQRIILLIGAVEMMTSLHNVQFNPMLTSWILMSYIMVHRKKDFWAAFFIAAGTLSKLYGIIGLAFFLFSDNKPTLVLSFIFWMAVLFCLPMFFSSPQFILQSYTDWYTALVEKNAVNGDSQMQGMTVMRIIKKIFMVPHLDDIYVLAGGAIAFIIPLFRFNQFKEKAFQLNYLAMLLIGVVIFSSSAESATFIIAMTGIGIWYVLVLPQTTSTHVILFLALLLTSFSTTDLFPQYVKQHIVRPYAVKAIPCLIVLIMLAVKLAVKDFSIQKQSI